MHIPNTALCNNQEACMPQGRAYESEARPLEAAKACILLQCAACSTTFGSHTNTHIYIPRYADTKAGRSKSIHYVRFTESIRPRDEKVKQMKHWHRQSWSHPRTQAVVCKYSSPCLTVTTATKWADTLRVHSSCSSSNTDTTTVPMGSQSTKSCCFAKSLSICLAHEN